MMKAPVYKFHINRVLSDYGFFSIGKGKPYFDETRTKERFNNYLPQIRWLKKEVTKKRNSPIALLLSGTFIELLKQYKPDLVDHIKHAASEEQVILVASTYHFSLASLYSNSLFAKDIELHKKQLKDVFGYKAKIIYNPSSVYFDSLSAVYKKLGFEYGIAPCSGWHLNGRNAQQVFWSKAGNIKLLLTSPKNEPNTGLVHIHDILEPTKGKTSFPDTLLSKRPTQSYLVPYPIHDQRLSNYIQHNALQTSIVKRITNLENKIEGKKKKTKLHGDLCHFSSMDYFFLLKDDQSDSRRPYDHYINLMNILSDFEIVNGL